MKENRVYGTLELWAEDAWWKRFRLFLYLYTWKSGVVGKILMLLLYYRGRKKLGLLNVLSRNKLILQAIVL